jgi:hypothetical protein
VSDTKKYTPTITSQQALKLSIPHTPEGKEFLEKLQSLLGVKELPFTQTCPPAGEGKGKKTLELHMDQEGWP